MLASLALSSIKYLSRILRVEVWNYKWKVRSIEASKFCKLKYIKKFCEFSSLQFILFRCSPLSSSVFNAQGENCTLGGIFALVRNHYHTVCECDLLIHLYNLLPESPEFQLPGICQFVFIYFLVDLKELLQTINDKNEYNWLTTG